MDKYQAIEKAFKAFVLKRDIEDEVPSEWFTARDFAKAKGMSTREAQRTLRVLVDDNTVEVKRFKIKTGLRIYPTIHYKPCDTTTRKSAKPR